jgi:predicted patatin/cPLA2 family phospholipase
MRLHSTITDVALVFEGGGMRASYTSAVVDRLIREGIFLDFVCGISAGSSNTVNYVSRDLWRTRRSFIEFAADPNFGSMKSFLRGDGLFNAEYIYRHTSAPGEALPFDFETFFANPAQFAIGAFDGESGRQVWWSREDIDTREQLMERVQASSSMPILMPPAMIDGRLYVDGALGPDGGIGLDIAQGFGYKKFFVVMTRPRSYVKPPTKLARAYRRYYRRYPAIAEALINRHKGYNLMREKLFDLEASGQAVLFFPDDMTVTNRTRDQAALQASFEAGAAQFDRELPALKDFLGL